MQNRILFKEERLIISLYDYTGEWAKPYIKNGYPVMLWDKKIEGDILEHLSLLLIEIETSGLQPYGFLFAPPCDDFAVSGARWFALKDSAPVFENDVWNGMEYSKALVLLCLHLTDLFPNAFWALENPVGRIETLIPELKPFRKLLFNPCDFGDAYTKKTILWGRFNHHLKKNPVQPKFIEYKKKDGSVTRFAPQFGKTGGKSERTKSIRSKTPAGFAKAFFEANK
jgi:hypothetical protein